MSNLPIQSRISFSYYRHVTHLHLLDGVNSLTHIENTANSLNLRTVALNS